VNSQGHRLTGYPVDPISGAVLPLGPISISTAALAPLATTAVTVGLNLDARSAFPAALTSGTVTGSAVVGTLVIGPGNDTLNMTVDGVASGAITIPNATYASASALAAAVETAINTNAALAAAGRSVTVTATSNILTVTSTSSAGATSTVAAPAGNAAANLFGGAPVVTGGTTLFSPITPTSYNSSTSLTTYDSLGNSHVASLYFQKVTANTWNVYLTMDGTMVPASGAAMGTLAFTTSGIQSVPAGGQLVASAFTPPGAATMNLTFDCLSTTQFGALFGVTQLSQTGYTSGQLSGFSTAPDGTIQGRYSNGQSQPMGQIVLVNFANAQGLQPLGNNEWADTSASGAALIGTPGAGSLGVLQSSAVEDSNVDLTGELVQMITAQRVYQANAQTIKAQDAILQTITNLR
jgi:flagellar hook protein FlgE